MYNWTLDQKLIFPSFSKNNIWWFPSFEKKISFGWKNRYIMLISGNVRLSEGWKSPTGIKPRGDSNPQRLRKFICRKGGFGGQVIYFRKKAYFFVAYDI